MKPETLVLAGIAAAGLAPAVQAKDEIEMTTIAPGVSAYLTMTTMASIVNRGQGDFEVQVDAAGAATEHMVKEGPMKLHPGTLRYYRERGLEIPAIDM